LSAATLRQNEYRVPLRYDCNDMLFINKDIKNTLIPYYCTVHTLVVYYVCTIY
jgi:hypothetical protein